VSELDDPPCPLREAQGILAFTVAATSRARILRGSQGSEAYQVAEPMTQAIAAQNTMKPPRTVISNRGGDDFFSATFGRSRTLTLGVSLAS